MSDKFLSFPILVLKRTSYTDKKVAIKVCKQYKILLVLRKVDKTPNWKHSVPKFFSRHGADDIN